MKQDEICTCCFEKFNETASRFIVGESNVIFIKQKAFLSKVYLLIRFRMKYDRHYNYSTIYRVSEKMNVIRCSKGCNSITYSDER